MKRSVKILNVVLILLLVFSSCKTYRDLENLRIKVPKDLRAGEIDSSQIGKLVQGDNLRITKKDGTRIDMIYQTFETDTLFGIDSNKSVKMKETLHVALSDIEELHVRRVSVALTIPLAAVGAYFLAFLIWAAVGIAGVENFQI